MSGRGGGRRRESKAAKCSSRGKGKRAEMTSDDDSSSYDAASVMSGESYNQDDIISAPLDENNEVDELTESFETALENAIDGLSEKNPKVRLSCFCGLEYMFATKYLPDFVDLHKMTISDGVKRGLTRGKSDERCSAAKLAVLLCIQVGVFESAEEVSKALKSTLKSIANDNTASNDERAECLWALSMNQFFSGNDAGDTVDIMQLLSTIFAGSYLKRNGAIATVSPDTAALHAAAISCWTLLLTVMSSKDIFDMFSSSRTNSHMPSLDRLRELLESPHLEVRLSAGEALAVIFEMGRDYDADYEQDWALDLRDVLEKLATDSKKYRSKKDRKLQRPSFRSILKYIEDDIVPEKSIRFGQETLYLEGWCAHVQYNACCQVLGPRINTHLAENMLLREIFQLGDKVVPIPTTQKMSKSQKALMHAASFKARTVHRNKNRDKRSAAMVYYD